MRFKTYKSTLKFILEGDYVTRCFISYFPSIYKSKKHNRDVYPTSLISLSEV